MKHDSQLEWLMPEGQPNKVISAGSFEDCYAALLALTQSAPYTPYATTVILYRNEGGGVKRDYAVFSFGRSSFTGVELKRVGSDEQNHEKDVNIQELCEKCGGPMAPVNADLLEACRRGLACVDDLLDLDGEDRRFIRDAIAKATGAPVENEA